MQKQTLLIYSLLFLNIKFIQAQKNNKIDKESLYGFFIEIEDSSKVNKQLPNFYATGNNTLTNDSIKGFVCFINMWISHCSPCVAEINALNNLYNLYKDNPKFKFISITSDDDKTINNFITDNHLQYPIHKLTSANSYKLNMNSGFPTKILVRADGKIEKFVSGGATESNIADELIKTVFYSRIDSLLKLL